MSSSTATKKSSSASEHPAYKDMIKEAILTLKERNGSSRQALKKYIQSNFKIKAANFETQFNAALKRGVAAGDFVQPKGPSGTVKLQKKESKVASEKKPAKKAVKPKAKKVTKPKAAAPKKATKPKAVTKKATKPKASGVTKKKVATKPKKAAPKKSTK
ncbi:linker histone H1 and H5 family-domain-containing protein [Dipodascopsis uninucleata]